MLEHLFQPFGRNPRLAGHGVKTHRHHIVKVFLYHLDGDVHILARRLALQLKQYALTQVTRCDARGVQSLHDAQHLLHLGSIDHIAVVERHVVGYLAHAAAQVAIVLQIAHDCPRDDLLRLVEFQLAQLVGDIFLKCFFAHRRGRIVLVVTAAVVGKVAVPGRRVFIAIGIDVTAGRGVVPGGFVFILAFARFSGIVVIVIVRLLLQRLNLADLVVDEFGHLGIVLLQHQSQHALLLQCQTLRLLLLQCESLFCHCR